jgi:hypothetical protein
MTEVTKHIIPPQTDAIFATIFLTLYINLYYLKLKGLFFMKINENLGFQIPSILLPKRDLDFQKWAVIACDQYTSEPEYWHDVETFVGDAPSTLKMVLPEVYLETDFENELIERTKKNMQDYLDQDIFQSLEGLILVERQTENNKRHGVMVALDLE